MGQQIKVGAPVLSEVINDHCHKILGLMSHNGSRKEDVWGPARGFIRTSLGASMLLGTVLIVMANCINCGLSRARQLKMQTLWGRGLEISISIGF